MIDHAAILKQALSRGGEYADLYLEQSFPFSIVCEDGRIEKVNSGMDSGAGLRLLYGLRTAYAYTNEVTQESLLELARAVSQAASGGARMTDIDLTRRKPRVGLVVQKPPESVSAGEKAALVMRANRAARAIDSRIRQAMVVYRENRQKVLIAHSGGVAAEDERMYLTALVHVVAADGDVVQTGYEPVGGLAGLEILDASPWRRRRRPPRGGRS